ncbi:MAG: hypothetical protein WAS21_26915 [Geminicoccaceae bacterium]
MSERKRIRIYEQPAGGWGALKALGEHLVEQRIPVKGASTLLRMNQPEGFDCPGCAWPDPKHTSSFEFCENGGKAVAWEATAKHCTPEFFAAHTGPGEGLGLTPLRRGHGIADPHQPAHALRRVPAR